jgi:hypothetical protein
MAVRLMSDIGTELRTAKRKRKGDSWESGSGVIKLAQLYVDEDDRSQWGTAATSRHSPCPPG